MGMQVAMLFIIIVEYCNLASLCQHRNMITLELIIGLSNIPFLIWWFYLPESPRWLLAKGRKEEAKKVINQACEWNGRPKDRIDAFVNEYKNATERKLTIADLVRKPAIR